VGRRLLSRRATRLRRRRADDGCGCGCRVDGPVALGKLSRKQLLLPGVLSLQRGERHRQASSACTRQYSYFCTSKASKSSSCACRAGALLHAERRAADANESRGRCGVRISNFALVKQVNRVPAEHCGARCSRGADVQRCFRAGGRCDLRALRTPVYIDSYIYLRFIYIYLSIYLSIYLYIYKIYIYI
jgi:hypothetical protein